MFLSPSQTDSMKRGNPGFGRWDFFGGVDCLPHQLSKSKGEKGACGRGSPPNAKSIMGKAARPTEKSGVHWQRGQGGTTPCSQPTRDGTGRRHLAEEFGTLRFKFPGHCQFV